MGCLFLLGLSLVLSVFLLFGIAERYNQAKKSREALEIYREILIAANAISAERGPTNTMLGGDFPVGSEVQQRLITFRANSDATLHRLQQIASIGNSDEWSRARDRLTEARGRIDAELSIPFKDRKLESISAGIEGMFSAVDAITPLMNSTALGSDYETKGLNDDALIGRGLFEIRDYAGRLGSILTPYIAKREPITEADLARLYQTLGRIAQIWELAKPHLDRQPGLADTMVSVEKIFFGDGIDLVKLLEKEALTGDFSFTTRSMTDAIVPTFAPLEKIRFQYLEFMISTADQELRSSTRAFFWVAIVSATMLAIGVALILVIQRMIFSPLLKARDQIVLLADEVDINETISPNIGAEEIREVFRALGILRRKLAERRQMTAELEVQAKTDWLTGLINRRNFDKIIKEVYHGSAASQDVTLIFLDIDKFKIINDTYGHDVGDVVLKTIAAILTINVRASDIVARFGGEEFAILLEHANLEVSKDIAETLRSVIESTPVILDTGRTLNVTASFGVAGGKSGRSAAELIKSADQALYMAKTSGRNRVCLE